ncbi:transposase, partial [bacterium]|nr:transposase [bacterium]
DASGETVADFLERLEHGKKTEEGQQIFKSILSDGWRSYSKATRGKDLVYYRVILRDPKAEGKLLPWVHKAVANAKSLIRGTNRGVSDKHLNSYLAEICYRFNRRFWEKELFDRLVQTCVTFETMTYSEIVGKTWL